MTNSYLQRKPRSKGKEIREAYIDAVDGLADLLEAIKKASKKGSSSLSMVEKIKVDSPHKALNYCLQSGAGVVAKRWMMINQEHMKELKLCASQLAFVHDELQFEVATLTHAQDLCSSLVLALQKLESTTTCASGSTQKQPPEKNWSEVH